MSKMSHHYTNIFFLTHRSTTLASGFLASTNSANCSEGQQAVYQQNGQDGRTSLGPSSNPRGSRLAEKTSCGSQSDDHRVGMETSKAARQRDISERTEQKRQDRAHLLPPRYLASQHSTPSYFASIPHAVLTFQSPCKRTDVQRFSLNG
jgi:hypothetical protein